MDPADSSDPSGSQLFDDAPTAVFLLDASGSCIRVNRLFAALTGLSLEQAQGAGWLQVLPAREREQAAAELARLIAGGAPFEREFEFSAPAGPRWLRCVLAPQSSAAGATYAFAGWLVDISARKRSEQERARLTEELRLSNELNRLVQRLGRFAYWTMRIGEARPVWSPEMFALWGRRLELGEPTTEELFARAAEPADLPRIKAATARLFSGEPDELEYRVLGFDGVYRWIHARREAVRGPHGEVLQVVGIAQDVTWRYDAARERIQRDKSLHSMTLALPDPAFVQDGQHLMFANAAFAALLGWDDPEQLIGLPLLSLLPSSEHERKQARTRRALAGGNNASIELTLLRRDGSALLAEVSSLAAEYEGRPAVLELMRDLSARRAAEEQRLVSDRATALATLAAGVAHEVNNPLAWLQSNVEMIADGLTKLAGEAPTPEMAELLAMASDAREGARRVKVIVSDLQTFSSRGHGDLAPLDPTDALELALRLADQELRGRGTVVKQYQPVPLVLADRAQLAQAFMNLLLNAAQAMAGGDPARSRLSLTVAPAPEGGAEIDIEDTGPGIAPEILPRIFDPFFTTKPIGSGTGLGLSVARNALKAMGGTITAQSEPGRGARFRVWLPRAEATRPEKQVERVPLPRVLVVDSDPKTAEALQRMLSRECEVVGASSAARALEALAEGPSFALLMIELELAGNDGIELYESIRARAPELASRVVFITGGAISPRERSFLVDGAHPLVEKPFQPDRVRAQVLASLTAAAPPSAPR